LVTPIAAITGSDSSVNQVSEAGTTQGVAQAIKVASARTGVDFSYLLNKASQESGFDPNAKASSSSATGLFQFTRQTWLQMVKTHGDQYGLGQYASQITTDSNGVAHVSDPAVRKAILDLRKNPTVSAEMAGELDKENMGSLKSGVGGKIGPTELYLAHFLGAGGANNFISTLRSDPEANAADVLPGAAAANPSVFYDQSGTPRSVSQIYQQFAQKFNHMPQVPSSATMLASATQMPPPGSFSAPNAASALAKSTGYSPSVISASGQASGPSLYTAMVIAQMDVKSSPESAQVWSNNPSGGHNKKNSAVSALQTMA